MQATVKHTRIRKKEDSSLGSLMNWSSWLAKVPAMKEPINTVMTWRGRGGRRAAGGAGVGGAPRSLHTRRRAPRGVLGLQPAASLEVAS